LARAGAVCEGCNQGLDECADHTLACKSGKVGTLAEGLEDEAAQCVSDHAPGAGQGGGT
jgi:hypothetical protein